MNTRFAFAPVLALAALVLMACNKQEAQPAATPPTQAAPAEPEAAPTAAPAPAAALSGYKHDAAIDVFGFYMPEGEVKFGKWVLSSVNIGMPQEFVDYESGKRDPPEYAPLNVEFYDETSPQVENELGGSNYSRQVRVLPTAYSIGDGRVEFAGTHPDLGEVRFSGALDVEAVKRATAAAGQSTDTSTVMRGTLTVGGKTTDVSFTWFGGD